MKTKLSIVIHSHLSAVLDGVLKPHQLKNSINFVKWLMIKHRNLDEKIDASVLWDEFTTTRFFQKY